VGITLLSMRCRQSKAFDLKVEFDQGTDGRWIADIPALPESWCMGRTRRRGGGEALGGSSRGPGIECMPTVWNMGKRCRRMTNYIFNLYSRHPIDP